MVWRLIISIALALVIGVPSPLYALERWSKLADTVFENFGQDQGLPNPYVAAIAQDKAGYLWIATSDGLARYDGYQFRIFRADLSDPTALPENYLRLLHVDGRNRLWIGTNAAGLVRYDPAHDKFATVRGGADQLTHARVQSIADDGVDGLWIGTQGGLTHLDFDSGQLIEQKNDPDNPHSLPDDRVHALLTDKFGRLWVGTLGGLSIRYPDGGFDRIPFPPSAGRGPGIWTMIEDSVGRIWIGTQARGAYVIHPGTIEPIEVQAPDIGSVPLNRERIEAIAEVSPNRIWLGTGGRGIVEIDCETWSAQRMVHDPARSTSLIHNHVLSLMRDRSGLIWVGGNGGLSRHKPNNGAILNVFGETSRTDSLSGGDVFFIAALPNQHLLVGQGAGGIDVLDPANTVIRSMLPDLAHPESTLDTSIVRFIEPIRSVAAEPYEAFVGTTNGLYRIKETGAVQRLSLPSDFGISRLFAGLIDGETLWVGTDLGLWRFNTQNPAIAERIARDSLTDQAIETIIKDRDGDLWIGTRNGLNRLDPRTGAVERIMPSGADPAGLSGSYVVTIHQDDRGRLWIGTLGGGVSVLERRDESHRPIFRRLGVREGMPNDNIAKILQDRAGNIWTASNNGIAKIDPNSFAITRLMAGEGAVIRFHWAHSGIATKEGEIIFGGRGGLTVVRPERIQTWSFQPPLVASEIRIGGHIVPNHERLRVPPDANSFSVTFAALDFSAPERNRYAYRLDGYDSDWTETDSSRRLATYTNLPPGQYVLRVKATNRIGDWDGPNLNIPVTVLPAWYQTLWFEVLAGLSGLMAVFVLIRVRTAQLLARQHELERVVQERTAELADKHRKLELMSVIDRLTGVYNRHFLDQTLEAEVARTRRGSGPLSVMVIDVDHFKQVNDTHGHLIGDDVLVRISSILREHIRQTDTLGRWGGEEFLLVCPNTPSDGALILGDKLRTAIEHCEFPVVGHETASFGIATWRGSETPHDLIGRADGALYQAKRAGRNRCELAE